MMNIRLTTAEWSAVKEELKKGPTGKIPAIKLVRLAAAHQQIDGTGRTFSSIGLREAKEAVEFYLTSIGKTHPDGTPHWHGQGEPAGRLVPSQPIKRIVVDMGEGEIEVDMEEMSLRFLSTMTTLRITDVQRLVDLWQRVKDWEEGQ